MTSPLIYRLFIFISLLVPSLAVAKVQVNLLLGYKSKSIYRGAETWPDPTLLIGPSIVINDNIIFRGPSLFYAPFSPKSPFTFQVGLNYFDDSTPLFTLTNHQKDYRNKRPDSFEFFTLTGINFQRVSLQLLLSKEVAEYYGVYGELKTQIKLIPFTRAYLKFGAGEKSTNQYIYGLNGKSGPGFYAYGISLTLPFLPWKGVLISSAEQSTICQEINRYADYVRGRYNLSLYTINMIWSF